MSLVESSLVFGAQAGEFDLRGGEAGGSEFDRSVLAGVETLLNDGNETVGVALLVAESGFALEIAVEGEVGDGGVFCHSFAGIFEVEIGRVEAADGGAHVVTLRVAEDERRAR